MRAGPDWRLHTNAEPPVTIDPFEADEKLEIAHEGNANPKQRYSLLSEDVK